VVPSLRGLKSISSTSELNNSLMNPGMQSMLVVIFVKSHIPSFIDLIFIMRALLLGRINVADLTQMFVISYRGMSQNLLFRMN
jgi:hypothetical protein